MIAPRISASKASMAGPIYLHGNCIGHKLTQDEKGSNYGGRHFNPRIMQVRRQNKRAQVQAKKGMFGKIRRDGNAHGRKINGYHTTISMQKIRQD